MALHVRTQIRQAVAAALAGTTTAGSRVAEGRLFNVGTGDLPCWSIYVTPEEIEPSSMGTGRSIMRELTLVCRATAEAATGKALDDLLDQLALEVEKALGADPTLGGLAIDLWPASIASEVIGEGDRPVGSIDVNFQITYQTDQGAPDVST